MNTVLVLILKNISSRFCLPLMTLNSAGFSENYRYFDWSKVRNKEKLIALVACIQLTILVM